MVSGFDIWGHDANLRKHWKNRALAFIVDVIISFVPVSIIFNLMDITDIFQFGIVISTTFYLKSSILESFTGSTIGKKIFKLQVHAVDGGSVVGRAYLRNISRLFWFILPPLDFALGMATRGDPRQRILDRVAGTKVVHRAEKKKYRRHMKALAKEQEAQTEEEPQPEKLEDICQDCGGKLILLADDKLQCEKCGLIQ
ncbi:MAG: RDD family protein [Thermoplasmata archaeon]|nr:RDD family protein [Thermoplasmata archaeon]